jgi:hypothetical protein
VTNVARWLAQGESEKEHLDHMLDEALAETFPASDPTAVS